MVSRAGALVRFSITAASLAVSGCPTSATTRAPTEAPPTQADADTSEVGPRAPMSTRPRGPWNYRGWTAQAQPDGSLRITHDHAPVVEFDYFAFGPNWRWAGLATEGIAGSDGVQRIKGKSEPLGLEFTGTLRTEGTTLHLEYELVVARALKHISGVGIELAIGLESSAWPSKPTAKLLENASGVEIQMPREAPIRVQAEGHARTHFERGDPRRTRIMFFEGDVEPGRRTVSVDFELPPAAELLPPLNSRYGAPDPGSWHADTVRWDDWPVDLSRLSDGDRPAGTHGKVRAVGDGLEFEDGTPARFWGTNIVAQTLFEGDKPAIERQAKRLAAMGFNLVRLHHHDAGWLARNVFDPDGPGTQRLRRDALDTLDWWAHCLANEGIYVWLDIHVSRRFAREDSVPGLDELARAHEGEAKGFSYVNPRLEVLMKQFEVDYVGRKNRYRGKKWSEDPAVAGMLVTNENDLTDHFGVQFLPDKGLKLHAELFEGQARKITKALSLPAAAARTLWQPGPGKVLLAEFQHRVNARALDRLAKLGVTIPIATTNYWGRGKLYSLAPLAVGDVLDVHSYGESESLSVNPRHESNWIHFIATASLEEKPVTVTEWSVPAPATDRFVAPLYAASIASLQGWDAMMSFAYNMGPNAEPERDSPWVRWTDPASIALAPAAALIYRRGDVRAAEKTFIIRPTVDQVWGEARNAENARAIRTLAEQSHIVLRMPDHPKLKWDTPPPPRGTPPGATLVTNLDQSFVTPDATKVVSDTGEIERDWTTGIQTIDTPRTAAAVGWIGGRRIELADVWFEIESPKAAVVLTALDDRPLRESQKILVTAVGRAVPDPARPGGYRAETIRGRFGIRHDGELGQIVLSARSRATDAPAGRTSTPGTREGQSQVFALPHRLGTHWSMLRP